MERVLANKANWLVSHGFQIVVVTTEQRGRKPFFDLDERIVCYDLNINYEENNRKSFFNKLVHYPFKQWKHRQRLTDLLDRLKADVVISMFCNDASFLPSINDGSKKLLEIHFSRYKRLQYSRKGLWRWADIWRSHYDEKIARRYHRFVVLTKEDREYWGNLKNICVIPNARTFEMESPTSLDDKKVIAIGRYTYQKGLDRLIDAWSIVCKQRQDWMLYLIGEGELRETLQEQISQLGLQDNVVLGKVETRVQPIYQQASIMVLSSHYEGLPMVLLEAQAAGLPIVSFDCKCGPKDVITDGVDGFLIKEGDVEAMANRILQLMDDDVLRKNMGLAAFTHSERYAESTIMQHWVSLFSQLEKV